MRFAGLISSRPVVAVFLLVLCGCEPYSRSNSGFSGLDKKVLYDFRKQAPGLPTTPDPAAARTVLNAAFPSHLSSARQCNTASAGTPAIVPAILGSADGPFTGAGLKQTAYLIDVRECGRNPGSTTRRLAVLGGGSVIANAEVPFGDAIAATYDLDGDGKRELLLTGTSTHNGELIQNASLVQFDRDKLITVEDFGQVYDDACDTDRTSRSVTARVISYLPPPAGKKPRFFVELYRAPCTSKGQPLQWERISGK